MNSDLVISNCKDNELNIFKYMDNIDNVENVLNLFCSGIGIVKILNYPSKLEFLDCTYNKIKYLKNLPNTLKYLDCYSNPIENLDYLPESLLVLKCSNCILPLNNLPISLLELDCESCILNLSNLQNLKYFRGVNCKSETNDYQIISKNMNKLILDGCNSIKINFNTISTNLYYIFCSKENINNLIYNSTTLDKNINEFKKEYPTIILHLHL